MTIKNEEKEILLKRFFSDDRRQYKLGKAAGLEWFNRFDHKFVKDKYAFFAREERVEAMKKLSSSELNDEKFVSALNRMGPPEYLTINRFVGKYYYFDAQEGSIFKLDDRRKDLSKEVQGALKDIGKRGYYLLKAIIDLYKEDRWDKAYGGATWIDILAKIRELGGMYPAPRDIPILKSYRIYYKTGSRRYPTHTIPEEMLNTVEKELERHKGDREKRRE